MINESKNSGNGHRLTLFVHFLQSWSNWLKKRFPHFKFFDHNFRFRTPFLNPSDPAGYWSQEAPVDEENPPFFFL